MTVRVLVVDDSTFVRKALTRVLNYDPDISVVAQAADGKEAIEKILLVKPDVVTLDLEMPRMDGLSTIAAVMALCPLPIIVLSAWAQPGAEMAVRALQLGAVEVIDKGAYTRMDIHILAQELIPLLKAVAGSKPRANKTLPIDLSKQWIPEIAKPIETHIELVCIGASTGGPQAIQTILTALPQNFPVPIVVVQHMPVGFTRLFAERLDSLKHLRVKEIEHADRLLPGNVYIAKAGYHLTICKDATSPYADLNAPRIGQHIPSVDVLFESAAKACGKRVVSITLTGMGQDGAHGAFALRHGGAYTIAEAEESCVVFGMPKAAIDTGAIEVVAPLHKIAGVLLSRVLK
jgi:two-component system, chemotaxis family, protein-glutamate methylesterase/glutaminase